MSQREQAIWNTDFANRENHYFSRMEESDDLSGFGYVRVYQSPAMSELELQLEVAIVAITRVSDGTCNISFDCHVKDRYGAIRRRFHAYQLRSLIHDESYIDEWAPDYPEENRSLGAYDMLFSELDENELQEKCMEYIKDWGLEEQKYLATKYNLSP